MTVCRTAALLLALVLLPSEQIAAEGQVNYINMFIRLDDQAEYGLHKLTSSERSRLNEVFGSVVERLNDNLRNAALAYLRAQGWREVEVTGTVEMDLEPGRGPARYVTAAWDGQGRALEPTGISTIMPGLYLGMADGDECRLINTEGAVAAFRIAGTLPMDN